MSTFLQELASRLLDNHTHDLSQLVMMFPSLRARAFFNDALSEASDRPTWQPRYTTIDDIMERGSGLVRGERIRLISELYSIYVKKFPNETFDRFYFWGDMLIADFDMIDKYMVDAHMLLRNITDLKELESDLSYLTESQEQILQFWRSIHTGESLTQQKQRFLEIWRALPAIYDAYKARLIELGIGYTGLLYRITAERIKRNEDIGIAPKRHIIAGFNALSTSEQILFDHIAASDHGAEFYWDYDNYYVRNQEHEAGLFMRNNIKRYRTTDALSHDNFREVNKEFTVTACVSNITQVKHIGDILATIPTEELGKDTAIVLTDENLLTPLLHSLPKDIGKVNITMGYPLKNSLIYSFLELLYILQTHKQPKGRESRFYHQDVTRILTHPYIVDCCGKEAKEFTNTIVAKRMINIEESFFADHALLSRIFVKRVEWQDMGAYMIEVIDIIMQHIPTEEHMQREHLRIASEEITKTIRSIEKCDITISADVFHSLLRRHLQTITIPYEGKPLEGIQILGILETRNVDFKNVIILSMTDANFPGNRTDQGSFIPYNLRLAYDIPTPEQHEAMYAYYFYRLLQRAKRVEILYCSRADNKSTGECSRYIYQLDFESPYNILKRTVGVDLNVDDERPIEIAKGEYEMAMLGRYTDKSTKHSLSPTALHSYVQCPLSFYFKHIAKLNSRNELTDRIDASTLGDILHKAMERLYTDLKNKLNPMAKIIELQNEELIKDALDKAISNKMFNDKPMDDEDYSGDTLLVRDILVKYILRGIMRYDINRNGFTITDLEKDIPYLHTTSAGQTIKLSGRADRIDTLPDGSMQIIDYKSGQGCSLIYTGIENLFRGTDAERQSNIFQTLLYSMMLHKQQQCDVTPSLYYASKMLNADYSPLIVEKTKTGSRNYESRTIERYSMVAEEFERELSAMLDELFDKNTPFRQAEDPKACTKCDYKDICRR